VRLVEAVLPIVRSAGFSQFGSAAGRTGRRPPWSCARRSHRERDPSRDLGDIDAPTAAGLIRGRPSSRVAVRPARARTLAPCSEPARFAAASAAMTPMTRAGRLYARHATRSGRTRSGARRFVRLSSTRPAGLIRLRSERASRRRSAPTCPSHKQASPEPSRAPLLRLTCAATRQSLRGAPSSAKRKPRSRSPPPGKRGTHRRRDLLLGGYQHCHGVNDDSIRGASDFDRRPLDDLERDAVDVTPRRVRATSIDPTSAPTSS
jgi:hypothetical protein